MVGWAMRMNKIPSLFIHGDLEFLMIVITWLIYLVAGVVVVVWALRYMGVDL